MLLPLITEVSYLRSVDFLAFLLCFNLILKSTNLLFVEGAVVSSCDDTITTVDSGSFRYFRTSFSVVNNKITIEVEDKEG